MNYSLERIARMLSKFLQRTAFENFDKRFVGVNNIFVAVGAVNQKSAGNFVDKIDERRRRPLVERIGNGLVNVVVRAEIFQYKLYKNALKSAFVHSCAILRCRL